MQQRKPPRKLDASELFDYALKTLGARAYSSSELRQKLLRRAADEQDIDGVMSKLKEYGYLNDRRFAESFTTTRRDDRGQGQMRVLRDLRQRRVAPKLAEQVVKQAYEEADEVKMIEEWLARKYRSVNLGEYLQEEKHLASAYRRLRYAGFSPGNIRRVLMKYAREGGVLDSIEEEVPDGAELNRPPTEGE